MADIELVIKIPEEIYKDIQCHDWKNGERWYSEEWKAIHNGKPLPKGHGRLIDADALKKSNEEYIIAYPMDEEECMRNTMVRWINDDITDAPTIVEADKAERNEE